MKYPDRVTKGIAAIKEAQDILEYILGKNSKEFKSFKTRFSNLENLIRELSMDQKTYGNWLAKKIKRDMKKSKDKKDKK